MDIDVFIPCSINHYAPETGMNMINLLENLDVNINYNPKLLCCGKEAFEAGYWDVARSLGEKFINEISDDKPIVIPSKSCVNMIKKNYPTLFKNSSLHNKIIKISKNTFELTDFLVKKLNISDFNISFPHKCLVLGSCGNDNDQSLKDLISKVRDINLIDDSFKTECCGSGLSFSITNDSISTSMMKEVVDVAIQNKVEYIISAESSCVLQLNAYLKKNSINIKALNIIDLLCFE